MKYAVIISALISVGLLLTGLYFNFVEDPIKDKFLGFGTLSLFFITFPLIIFWRSKKFDINKYVWRNESTEDIKNKKKSSTK